MKKKMEKEGYNEFKSKLLKQKMPLYNFCWALTKGRLQHASVFLTVSDWLDLWGVNQAPEVILVVGPIQAQAQPWAGQTYHRGNAGGRGVPRVLGLQLHPSLELIDWRCEALDVGERWTLARQHDNKRKRKREAWNYRFYKPVWSRKTVQR